MMTARAMRLNAPLTSTIASPRHTTGWGLFFAIGARGCTRPSAISEKPFSGHPTYPRSPFPHGADAVRPQGIRYKAGPRPASSRWDPNYAPAYKLLGKWWEELEENDEQAAMAYARYVALTPDDPEGRELLSRRIYAAKISTASSISWKTTSANIPEEIASLPILAQACLELNRVNWAQAYFFSYVDRLPPQRRALYEDIRFLASIEELAEYTSLDTDAARSAFCNSFGP